MKKLFGRDGIRGLAVTELTCEFAVQLGRAFVSIAANRKKGRLKVLVGRDTRSCADVIESALCAGICSAGADVELLGEVPTAALAWNIPHREACGGIMITANHLGCEFSGMKLFSHHGYRLSDDREYEVERLIAEDPDLLTPKPRREYGKIVRFESAVEDYMDYLRELSEGISFRGMKVALDCANGVLSYTVEELFHDLGARVVTMSDAPDGSNINETGSTNIEDLMAFVTENRCFCGFAFDGAGERCLAVDENGTLIDGDAMTAVIAKYMAENDMLRHNTLLVTHANSLGLLQYAKNCNIVTSMTQTGERSRLRRMLDCNFSLCGDPTGHILFPDDIPTADGQLTAIKLLSILRKNDMKMSEVGELLEKMPQVMMNVPIIPEFSEVWKSDRVIMATIDSIGSVLGDDGRIVVREDPNLPAVRVMIEGRDFTNINDHAMKIARIISERMYEN